ncbi:MAG: polysaccharide pyruvyl transferase family protein, partial [Candidatus Margulisiibacteriota bacterium]
YAPVFVLFQCPQDMHETSRVINYMQEKSSVIFRMCRPQEMLSLVSQFDLLIGMRLHSLIFSAMSQVPMLGISYDPKIRAFMKKIDQPCLNVNEGLVSQKLRTVLEKILADKEKVRINLEAKRKGAYDQALLNFDIFFDHLKPGRKLQKTKK